jgi:hypothetical protein
VCGRKEGKKRREKRTVRNVVEFKNILFAGCGI